MTLKDKENCPVVNCYNEKSIALPIVLSILGFAIAIGVISAAIWIRRRQSYSPVPANGNGGENGANNIEMGPNLADVSGIENEVQLDGAENIVRLYRDGQNFIKNDRTGKFEPKSSESEDEFSDTNPFQRKEISDTFQIRPLVHSDAAQALGQMPSYQSISPQI